MQAIPSQCNYQKLSKTINIGVALTVALFDAKVEINKLKPKKVSIYNYTKGIESPIPFLIFRHHDSKYHVRLLVSYKLTCTAIPMFAVSEYVYFAPREYSLFLMRVRPAAEVVTP